MDFRVAVSQNDRQKYQGDRLLAARSCLSPVTAIG